MAAITARTGTRNWGTATDWVGDVEPVEGDTVIIPSGSTMNLNKSVTVGADTSTAAIDVQSGGTLQCVNPGASYTLTAKGDIKVTGTFTVNYSDATNGAPYVFTLKLNYSASLADIKYGMFTASSTGTITFTGASRTYDRALLSADASPTGTSLTTNVSTGWLSGDDIAVATTSQTAAECERFTLGTNASDTTVTLPSGLAYAHSGTAPTQAEIILLTRNVVITNHTFSATAASNYAGYVYVQAGGKGYFTWVQFVGLGSNTNGKWGVGSTGTNATLSVERCTFVDTEGHGGYSSASTGSTVTFINNVGYNIGTGGVTGVIYAGVGVTSGTFSATITGNTILKSNASTNGSGVYVVASSAAYPHIIMDNTAVGAVYGFYIDGVGGGATVSAKNNVAHGNGTGFYTGRSGCSNGTWETCTAWRNVSYGFNLTAATQFRLLSPTAFGNGVANLWFNQGTNQGNDCNNIVVDTPLFAGDTTFATPYGIVCGNGYTGAGSSVAMVQVTNGSLGVASGVYVTHTTADVRLYTTLANNIRPFVDVTLANVAGSNSIVWDSPSQWATGPVRSSMVRVQRKGGTAGVHLTSKPHGVNRLDSVIYRTASPSERVTPSSSTYKLYSATKQKRVSNGSTATFSVYIRKSVVGDVGGFAYGGAQPRLILKANPAAGIASDVVLQTAAASNGTWEQLSGTSATVTDDAVLEAYVDCDGTSGAWINVDDWA